MHLSMPRVFLGFDIPQRTAAKGLGGESLIPSLQTRRRLALLNITEIINKIKTTGNPVD